MTIFLIVLLGLLYMSIAVTTWYIAVTTIDYFRYGGLQELYGVQAERLALLPALTWPICLPVVLCIIVLTCMWASGGWIKDSLGEWKSLLNKMQNK